jgi:hypothetical protein
VAGELNPRAVQRSPRLLKAAPGQCGLRSEQGFEGRVEVDLHPRAGFSFFIRTLTLLIPVSGNASIE